MILVVCFEDSGVLFGMETDVLCAVFDYPCTKAVFVGACATLLLCLLVMTFYVIIL